jgi:AcrR family transcriptional regulator
VTDPYHQPMPAVRRSPASSVPGNRPRRVDPRIEHTRQLVLTATLELMAEHDSGPITVERIAERSEVARSTIYRRWPDLPHLYFEAFRQLRSQGASEPTGDTPADLATYIAETAARLNDTTYFSIILFLMANAGRSEQYAALHLELFAIGSSRGAAVFLAGIASGMIDPGVDVVEASDVVRVPLVFTRLAKHEPIDVEQAQRAVRVVMRRYGTARGLAALRRHERLGLAGPARAANDR